MSIEPKIGALIRVLRGSDHFFAAGDYAYLTSFDGRYWMADFNHPENKRVYRDGLWCVGTAESGDFKVLTDGISMTDVIDEIRHERERQIAEEGWTPEHDDKYTAGELIWAAGTYAQYADSEISHGIGCSFADDGAAPGLWPWAPSWWKPKTRRRDLIRAAALLVAEIERLDRFSS